MKIKKLKLKNYKKFDNKEINFCDSFGSPNDIVIIVGENGSGKSSIMQSIGLLVGSAVFPFGKPSTFQYPGFNWDNIQKGRFPLVMDALIEFSDEEITATQEFSQKLKDLYPQRKYPTPGNNREIEISLSYDEDKVVAKSKKLTDFLQIKGYEYALQLSKFEKNFDILFEKIGAIYSYNEQRTAISINNRYDFNIPEEDTFARNKNVINERSLKEILFKWYVFSQNKDKFTVRENQRVDFFVELEKKYASVFKGRSFKGFAPKMKFDEMLNSEQDFWLYDGRSDYEFSEMSAGERAIFPILFDFARRKINNSIVLIDEIELHLHPPLQQALLRALPLWGKNNQFIITTHSDDIATQFSESQIIRL